jgi:tryptophan synthase alpha chain
MNVFADCKRRGRAALIAYLMAGDPSLPSTFVLAQAAVEGGADVLELGIPYSDPLADGPAIASAAQRALSAGTTFDGVLAMVQVLARRVAPVPLFAFSYYNPIFARGIERAAAEFRQAGLAGAIVPDLPPEEAQPLVDALARERLESVFLVAPTTPAERAARIAEQCTGFVYVVSRMGVTGASVGQRAKDLVARLRSLTDKPLAVGFGIRTAADAQSVASVADGVIVGSALVERAAGAANEGEAALAVRGYCAELAAVM